MKFKLIDEVMQRSNAKNWDDAIKEWKYETTYLNEDFETCLCGHYPIKEVIIMSNKNTFYKIHIGNCCISKFFPNMKFNKIFQAIKRGKVNRAIIDYCYNKNFILNKEYTFLCDIWRKRNLTIKQLDWFNYLNKKLINYMKIKEDKDGEKKVE